METITAQAILFIAATASFLASLALFLTITEVMVFAITCLELSDFNIFTYF